MHTGKLSKEDHDVGVDDGTASARFSEEVHPGEAIGAARSDLSLLLFSAYLHNEELLASLQSLDTTNAFPDLERLQVLALVHEVTGRLRHEEDTNTHDSGEDERGTEDVAPVARDADEHGSDSVSKNFTKSDVELVQRNQVTTKSAFDGLSDIDGDCTTLKTNTGAKDDTGGDNHAIVHSTSLKRTTNGVKNAGNDDSPAAPEVLVARGDEESTSNSC